MFAFLTREKDVVVKNQFKLGYLDIKRVTEAANNYNIPLEFNCANLMKEETDLKQLDIMLQEANRIYVNSDAHSSAELRLREEGLKYLKKNGFI